MAKLRSWPGPSRSSWCWPSRSLSSCWNRSPRALLPSRRRPRGVSSRRPSRVLDQAGLGQGCGPARPAAPGCGRRRRRAAPGPRRGRPPPAPRATGSTTAGARAGPARPRRSMSWTASGIPNGSLPPTWYWLPHCSPGKAPCRWRPRRSTCHRRSMSSRSWAERAWSWARCSGVSEFMNACMAAICRAICSSSSSRVRGLVGEEVAEALHEALEVGLLAALPLVDHLVERRQHVLHPGDLLRAGVRDRPRHRLELAVQQLLAKVVHQLLEPAGGIGGDEVVLLQGPDLAGEVGRQQVELHATLRHGAAGDLLATGVA